MPNNLLIASIVCCLSTASWGMSNASASDACETFLCMAGKVEGGDGGSECISPERAFFNIVRFHHGNFSSGRTSDARKSFLSGCEGADPDLIDKIINAFGGIRF